MADTAIWNFKQLAHHELDGFGGIGEGMSIQIAKDGRRILWLAHESAPKNFTAVDVSDPRAPKLVARADLPQSHMRSNSLETVGDIMAVAYQTTHHGLQPAGFELFDISVPENPRSITFFDCSGPNSRGVHQLWFADGEYIHMSSGSPDFVPTHPKDDQFYRIIDVKNPSKPVEVGRWWLPGTKQGDSEPPPERHPEDADTGFRPHNTNVYPERPDRAYLGYIDGGHGDPRHFRHGAPEDGVALGLPPALFRLYPHGRPVLRPQSVDRQRRVHAHRGADWPKLVWIVDGRSETNPVPISTCPLPPLESFMRRGARYGAHNLYENLPKPNAWKSDRIVLATYFNGGLRAYDTTEPLPAARGRVFRPGAAGAGAERGHPDQRRVRRRAPDRLHGRPPCRRALHARNGVLIRDRKRFSAARTRRFSDGVSGGRGARGSRSSR